jgi:hypothetical protein
MRMARKCIDICTTGNVCTTDNGRTTDNNILGVDTLRRLLVGVADVCGAL